MSMTTSDAIDLAALTPITHAEAGGLAEEAYRRLAASLASVAGDEWERPTDCTAWTVRDLAGHLASAMAAAASLRENLSQQRAATRRAKRDGVELVDGLTAEQVERAAGLSPDALVARIAELVAPATRGRMRTPGLVRKVASFKVEMGEISERWTLGYFVDVILTRDAWLHQVDLCRALGRELPLDAEHDGRIVADVAAEWARRHGKEVELVLTGPAGGQFRSGEGGPILELDAIDFCRIVSGRAEPTHELLGTAVPF